VFIRLPNEIVFALISSGSPKLFFAEGIYNIINPADPVKELKIKIESSKDMGYG
jgi:hypothetical protein